MSTNLHGSNTSHNSNSEYSLSFASSSSRQRRQPLHCPAVLRKEVTLPSKKRSSSSRGSTGCAPYQQQHQKQSQWLNAAVTGPYTRSPLATPSSNEYGQSPFFAPSPKSPKSHSPTHSFLSSPPSPSSAFLPFSSSNSAQSVSVDETPQGVLLPRSEWQPDSSVTVCQSRDCEISFGPARHDAASLFGGLTSMIAHPFQSRRHHCRACGKIFCGNHSSNTLFLLNAGNDIQPGTAPSNLPSPSLPSIARFGSRRGSMPASGTATPSLSSSNHFPNFEAPAGSPNSVNGISSGQIVNARVCDDCHVSALVQASLGDLTFLNQQPSSPIARQSTSTTRLSSKSTPVSLQASPQNSQTLPVGGRLADSNQSSAASSARTRQESAGTQSATSTADSSVDTSSTTPPPLSSKLSPSSAEAAHSNAVSREISPALVAPLSASRTSSSSTYRTEDRIQPPRLQFPEYRGETTKVRHPLDPGHGRVGILSSDAADGGAGSNPDGSLESSIGTPGVGWTWSTF